MQRFVILCLACALLLSATEVLGRSFDSPKVQLSSSGKPLIKRPPGRRYKTILSADGGALRTLLSSVVLVEVEQSIKRYLLANPHFLPANAQISSVDDFDINLADYFDCMTGVSAGAWSALYLASRGGQGASRAVLDDPAIVEKYGVIPTGGVDGLRVLFREYALVIYPLQTVNLTAGIPFDFTNPLAPGVAEPLFPLDGLGQTLEAFYGNTTLSDLDTSVFIPTVDLRTGYSVFFVQNAFRKVPVPSAAVLVSNTRPRPPPTNAFQRVSPDLVFDESKDYYLKDIGQAAGSAPGLHPAKSMVPVGSDTEEFLAVDGIIPIEKVALPTGFFVASEIGDYDFERIAILSIGNGRPEADLLGLANAGIGGWLNGLSIITLYLQSGLMTVDTMLDYIYYSNPQTKPFQYLRVQYEAPLGSEDIATLAAAGLDPTQLDAIEAIGQRVAAEYRPSIDAFVKDFLFG